MHTKDLTQDHIAKIRELFPNCVTEAKDAQGAVKLVIDFDLLRQELSGQIVEGPQERYALNWPGKRESLLTANAPIAKTLRPARDESVDFDTTKNLFIEGDNLEALKLLQETYLGKIKMIYIDPPYNTGNDFIYEDDFADDVEAFKVLSNQKTEDGIALVANTDANGRFHSDWLSMMYSRLKLARNLLAEDGLIFISIDDNELVNLTKVGNEVFGEKNLINHFVWNKNSSGKTVSRQFPINIDHILMYSKSNAYNLNVVYKPLSEATKAMYNKDDNDGRGKYRYYPLQKTKSPGPETTYDYVDNNGKVWPCPEKGWRMIQSKLKDLENDNRLAIDGKSLQEKAYWNERDNEGKVADTLWDDLSENNVGTAEVKGLFGSDVFDNPKPTDLIRRCIKIATSNDDIVLDFFAGSSTTAHAILAQNAEDGGHRKFVMVQLPEECDPKSVAFKEGYKTIPEVSKERIRRAGKKIQNENPLFKGDIGFRVLKIDTSNMADIYYVPDAVKQSDLLKSVENIKPDRTGAEDLLFQVLLDWGVDLTLPIAREKIAGKQVYFVDGNALAACFETGVSEDFVKELAARKPLRVVFRDNGFTSDAVKINVGQIFKQLSPSTEVRSI